MSIDDEENPFALAARAFAEGQPSSGIELELGGRLPNILSKEPQKLIREQRERMKAVDED